MSSLDIQTAEVFEPLLEPSRYKGCFGGRGCVHPETLIDTPSGQVKVKDFKGGEVYSWSNKGLVVASATAAKPYTREALYKVTLTDGRSIICTDEHKFLTDRGWVKLVDLWACDAVVSLTYQVDQDLPCSTSGTFPLRSLLSAQHCFERLLNCLGYCLLYLRLCGQQLRFLKETFLAFLPLPIGAQLHNYHVLFRSGGLAFFGIGSLSSIFHRLSSRVAPFARAVQYCVALGSRIFEIFSALLLAFCQFFRQSRGYIFLQTLICKLKELLLDFGFLKHWGETPRKPCGKLQRDVFYETYKEPFGFEMVSISSIRYHSHLVYWDLHVFGTNNYLSNGIVNHNSGKSHFFAEDLIDHAIRWPYEAGEGLRALAFREIQKSLKESAKFLIESKIKKFGLTEADGFKVYNDRIATPGDGLIAFTGLQDHTADSIKSYEGFHVAWGEESQSISHHSLNLLRPTIRWEDSNKGLESELWFSWNPRHKRDAVDLLLRSNTPSNATVVRANWDNNPWFPSVLEQERLDCLNNEPDQYEHIWNGDYVTVSDGAYYAKHLAKARQEGRIATIPVDPLMTIRLFVDIGGTGAKADAFTIWAAQFVGHQIKFINYYEAVGQPLDAHLAWMRENGYTPDRAQIWLPHDGKTQDKVYDVSYESALKQSGYKVTVIPNQGKGAAKARIEAGRRLFNSMWFDPEKCQGGLEALGWYHEKKDETRNIGLGPDHDWSSHAADSFGLAAIVYEPPTIKKAKSKPKIRVA